MVYPYNGMQHSNKKELLIHAIPLMNLEIIMLYESSLTKVMYKKKSYVQYDFIYIKFWKMKTRIQWQKLVSGCLTESSWGGTGGRDYKGKETYRWWLYSLSWLQLWFPWYTCMSKPIKLYTLNVYLKYVQLTVW